jgi:acid phosphatase
VIRRILIVSCFYCAAGLGQPADLPAHQKLIPALWVQTSEEWRAVAQQSYRLAASLLDQGLKNKRWSAAIEQQGDFRKLPPAVVLDIDETVLDNSPSQAREVKENRSFNQADWTKWVSESAAGVIPGASEFCRYAASRKVAVYFISNRDAIHEAATRTNLARHGFPLDDATDTVLLRGEKPEWTSDKGSRRAAIAAKHRILLLIGDDLGDFLSGVRVPVEKRRLLVDPHRDKWGTKWIMLPNPGYGSWEDVLYGEPRPPTPEERLARKVEHLRTR